MVVVALFALVVAACGDDGQDAATGRFNPAQPGHLVVATELPAPGFWTGTDPAALDGGYEWGIARELARRFDLVLDVVDVPFARIVAGDLGGADLAMAQIAVTDARRERLAFSESYLTVNAGVLTRPGTDVVDLADARELSWAVERSTTEVDFLADEVRPDRDPIVADDLSAVVDLVSTGTVAAGLVDLRTALATARQHEGSLEVPAQFITAQRVAVALPRSGPDGNLEAVDSALRALDADGTLQRLDDDELKPALGRDPDSVPAIRTR